MKKYDTRFTRITRFSGFYSSSIRNTRALYATRDIVDRFFVNNLVDAMSTWCAAGILFNLLSPKVLVISRACSPRRSPLLLPAEQLSRFAFWSTRHQMALRERPQATDFQTRDPRIICCALVNIQIVEYISRSYERRASFLRVKSNGVCDSFCIVYRP